MTIGKIAYLYIGKIAYLELFITKNELDALTIQDNADVLWVQGGCFFFRAVVVAAL